MVLFFCFFPGWLKLPHSTMRWATSLSVKPRGNWSALSQNSPPRNTLNTKCPGWLKDNMKFNPQLSMRFLLWTLKVVHCHLFNIRLSFIYFFFSFLFQFNVKNIFIRFFVLLPSLPFFWSPEIEFCKVVTVGTKDRLNWERMLNRDTVIDHVYAWSFMWMLTFLINIVNFYL